jgi:hypothetical protein
MALVVSVLPRFYIGLRSLVTVLWQSTMNFAGAVFRQSLNLVGSFS